MAAMAVLEHNGLVMVTEPMVKMAPFLGGAGVPDVRRLTSRAMGMVRISCVCGDPETRRACMDTTCFVARVVHRCRLVSLTHGADKERNQELLERLVHALEEQYDRLRAVSGGAVMAHKAAVYQLEYYMLNAVVYAMAMSGLEMMDPERRGGLLFPPDADYGHLREFFGGWVKDCCAYVGRRERYDWAVKQMATWRRLGYEARKEGVPRPVYLRYREEVLRCFGDLVWFESCLLALQSRS